MGKTRDFFVSLPDLRPMKGFSSTFSLPSDSDMECEEEEGKWKCYLRGARGYLREEIVSGIKMIATEDR